MKLTRWLLKTVLTVLLISGLTIMTTGLIVNSYVQSLLSSFNITLEGQSFGFGSMVKGLFGFKSGNSEDKEAEQEKAAKTPEETDSKASSDASDSSSGSGSGTDSSGSGAAENREAPDHAFPVMGGGVSGDSGTGSASTPAEGQAGSTDAAQTKRELTGSEKEQIFNMLITKLPPAELQKISSAMEDGLSEDELKTIEASITRYLSAEEYDSLKRMLEP
ncbi:hypothetical protein RJP21_08840 [Paenibacillus sp. VCA1]|uniref:hypothetical protein n=1 Tax=Paenibacillus sp. VCA1 TaxID=3039148 RepID=UPI00287208C0|nr:hypothetical protein [Paenibacillus sp. VCA1]MDR9853706.1 hypothetical protein [Paenibacillus sp. VCA1]